MTWRDSLTWPFHTDSTRKKASFRNAFFFVQDTDTNFGRRNIVHQYPLKETPYVEDIGADTDEFTIVGYVVQNSDNDQNYFTERDELIKALKEGGPGQLWHPFLGILDVSLIGKAEMSESFREGGIARFTMTFVRSDEKDAPFPNLVLEPVSDVDNEIESGFDSVTDEFYVIAKTDDDVPSFSTDSISTTGIQGAFPAQVSEALSILATSYGETNLLSVIQDTCSLANGIINMTNGLQSLIGEYGDILTSQLLGQCSSAVRGLSNGPWGGAQVEDPNDSGGFIASTASKPTIIGEDYGKSITRAALGLSGFGELPTSSDASTYGGSLSIVSITSDVSARQSANQVALINLIRFIGISTAMKAAIRVNYTSHNTVIEILDEIIVKVNAHLLKLGNESVNTTYSDYNINISAPESYQALESLKEIFVESMLAIAGPLKNIVEYKVPPVTTTSLVVAYNKYNDLDREGEVINRNISLIQHPGFLPGGRILELLND